MKLVLKWVLAYPGCVEIALTHCERDVKWREMLESWTRPHCQHLTGETFALTLR